jgi:serine/threonine protein kinase
MVGDASLSPKQRAKQWIGEVVAKRYRVDKVLAMGAFGAVFSAEHVHMRNKVALKLLHPETEGLPELVQRFERESIVGAHANHPNVAKATDFGELDDGAFYLVLEHIDGITLRQLMRKGEVGVERSVDIARQLALGLGAVHKLDIVHRDLKPTNVMLAGDDHDLVKLIDFGFAKLPVERFVSGDEKPVSLTSQGMLFGTIGYMAPEITFGMHAVGPPGDLYALGVILYELLTGKHPWDDKDKKLFRRHQMEQPPSFAERAPDRDIPAAIEEVVMCLLEKAPDDRYDNAAALVEALDEAMDEAEAQDEASDDDLQLEESPAPTPVSVAPPPKKPRSNTMTWALLGALVAVAAVVYLRPRFAADDVANRSPSAPPAAASTSAAATATATAIAASKSAKAPAAKARPTSIEGADAKAWRGVLAAAAKAGNALRGSKALLAVAAIDPELFAEPLLIRDAAAVAVVTELGDKETADRVFAALASDDLGEHGPDVLYQMMTIHGGSRGAKRATTLLSDKAVLANASSALRAVILFRAAPCNDKTKYFEQIGEHGDERAMVLMRTLRVPDCTDLGCCIGHHPGFTPSLAKMKARLSQ